LTLPTFYFDRCFGKRFPEALERAKPPFPVEYQHSKRLKLRQNLADDEWLKMCGERGWVAFSHDRKFHAIEVEALAIKQHSVASFCLSGANNPTWDKLCHFVKALPKIMAIVEAETPPYLYRVHITSRIEKVELP
jgi:hypothetical protein